MAESKETKSRCLVLLLAILLCFPQCQIISAQKRITTLPGFDGPLPFSLETGYLEVDEENGVEYFYYFIESESNPDEDPLMLWLTGGPGCSAFSGLAFEIGPLSFNLQGYRGGLPSLLYRADSWTQISSIIFVDYPVGTGFSYSRTEAGYRTSDSQTVQALVTFLYKWLEKHPRFKSNPLYICGDSFGGKIIPILTLKIAIAKESNTAIFNLKGYLAGNPVTTPFDSDFKVPFSHGKGLISDELYECTKKNCGGRYSNPINAQCASYLSVVTEVTKDVNIGHILEPSCEFHSPRPGYIRIKRNEKGYFDEVPLLSSGLPLECRESGYLLSTFWANNETVRYSLGIRKGTVADWSRCSNVPLPYTSDIPNSVPYHLNVTNKGYSALIYSGDHDFVITHVGTQYWIRSLNFSIVDDWRPWYVGGQVAGFTRRYSNNLTFATVKGAGHTAPEYKPKECLEMLRRWLSGAPL